MKNQQLSEILLGTTSDVAIKLLITASFFILSNGCILPMRKITFLPNFRSNGEQRIVVLEETKQVSVKMAPVENTGRRG
jgi:hypothetical protein